ncbi:hypothetical protein H696_04907 [Fonticula alba]|uniref:Sulfotransferase domain-containing protein n=1 Tax=Fonticula alba TaxID=691883 RepID=A0A058Z2V7_FONAL|nr:hypothetical protein H696_04907 [Fonticula alba]KCV68614.1 hypothetical protein H696_04907 [Fonticula alba]|eukprot:XP_009497046.1 hypothetical protein H696_04907 [Fonticula alba]
MAKQTVYNINGKPGLIDQNDNPLGLYVPAYWYVWPFLTCWLSFWFLSGLWPIYLALMAVYAYACPFGTWARNVDLLFRALRPFEGFSWLVNLNSVAICMSRFLVLWPLETVLWHIDEIFFKDYHNVTIKEPVFLVGQPRSGTTKLESILAEDERLLALTLFEMRFPYLCVQYALDLACELDKRFLGNRVRDFVVRNHLNCYMAHDSPRAKMRRLRFDLSDEDDTIFLFHHSAHFMVLGAFPCPDFARDFYHFDWRPKRDRANMMDFHQRCVKKVLYRRGKPDSVYFSKWVAGWNGQLSYAIKQYPDARYICLVRNPESSLPSWMRLQGLLAQDFAGIDVMAHKELARVVREENAIWFRNQIEFCRNIVKPSNLYLVRSEKFYENIYNNTHSLYQFLRLKVDKDSAFERTLLRHQEAQADHQPTRTDERHITRYQIFTEFPDIVKELFPEEAEERDRLRASVIAEHEASLAAAIKSK